MNDAIFLVNTEGSLERIPHTRYESEDLLQQLIATHPDVLVGDQIDLDNPPRWLLIEREVGIPDHEDGCDRWALDHLLLDQSGRPTFVEVKRSSDTRIRREVVGQMLDYAANARIYWPKDKSRALAAEVRQYEGKSVRALVPRVIGQTEFAKQQKPAAVRSYRKLTQEAFLARCPPKAAEFFAELLKQAQFEGYQLSWNPKKSS
jgi:hypothetical protein